MHWATKYIGRKYNKDGADCYCLVREVLEQEACITLPDFSDQYEDAENRKQVATAIEKGIAEFRQVEEPEEFDVVVLRVAAQPFHCALYIGQGRILHTLPGHDAAIENLYSMRWKDRIEGFYRWAS